LEKDISSLIGNDFLEHFLVTINWADNVIYLDSLSKLDFDNQIYNGLTFKPNFKTSKIEVNGISTKSKLDVKVGAELTAVNGIDISNLSLNDLCEFWNTQWPFIVASKEVSIMVNGEKLKLK